jgi:hypothetical protein
VNAAQTGVEEAQSRLDTILGLESQVPPGERAEWEALRARAEAAVAAANAVKRAVVVGWEVTANRLADNFYASIKSCCDLVEGTPPEEGR